MLSNSLLQTTPYRTFDKWYVEYYLNSNIITSSYPLIELKNIITPVRRRIKKNDYDGKLPIVSKIVFKTGDIIFRDENKTGMDLLQVQKEDLLVSSINFHQGAVAYNEICEFVCSTHYQTYKINQKIVLPQYLIEILRSETFINCVSGVKANGIKNESGFGFIGEFKIPLPSIAEQKALLDAYNDRMKKADDAETKAEKLNSGIDEFLFECTNCKRIYNNSKSNSLLQMKAFSKMLNWGANINANAVSPKELFFSQQYKNISLASISEINPTTKYPEEIKNENISFLPMECISDVYGEIAKKRCGSVADTKGYTRFQENDILWAKITPCMQNGKCAIATGLQNKYGYGSTEYHIIRVNQDKVLPEYIYCFLRTKIVRQVAQTYFSGSAGQQRVGADYLENLNIPLIPIRSDDQSQMTQEKIVKQVFEIKTEIKALRKEAESLRQCAQKEFEEAVFSEA